MNRPNSHTCDKNVTSLAHWCFVFFKITSTATAEHPINTAAISRSFKSHVFPIRLHFLAVINSSRLSRWSTALNTDSMYPWFLLDSLPSVIHEERQLYCVKGYSPALEDEVFETIGRRGSEILIFQSSAHVSPSAVWFFTKDICENCASVVWVEDWSQAYRVIVHRIHWIIKTC